MRPLVVVFACLFAVIVLAGCVVVRPADAALIDSTAANARAYAAAIAEHEDVPAGVRGWIDEDAVQWSSFADWANGRKPGGE
ncbi:MAG: hypothetical protein Q8P46_12575 [Hyphomicrobiales bacterium]|nr:hypothetical protein [Hyphomicrobiales bacterium]